MDTALKLTQEGLDNLSAEALRKSSEQLGEGAATFIQADLGSWTPERQFDIWHDRAAFHFLTEPGQKDAYREALVAGLRPGGLLILATFAEDGPEQCSGLDIRRYSAAELAQELPAGFDVIHTQRETHTTPSGGSQSFVWLIAVRTAN
jgi:trans-aconitate methyltransferase